MKAIRMLLIASTQAAFACVPTSNTTILITVAACSLDTLVLWVTCLVVVHRTTSDSAVAQLKNHQDVWGEGLLLE